MKAHPASSDPEHDSALWLPVITVLTSTAGLGGAIWLAVSMLF